MDSELTDMFTIYEILRVRTQGERDRITHWVNAKLRSGKSDEALAVESEPEEEVVPESKLTKVEAVEAVFNRVAPRTMKQKILLACYCLREVEDWPVTHETINGVLDRFKLRPANLPSAMYHMLARDGDLIELATAKGVKPREYMLTTKGYKMARKAFEKGTFV